MFMSSNQRKMDYSTPDAHVISKNALRSTTKARSQRRVGERLSFLFTMRHALASTIPFAGRNTSKQPLGSVTLKIGAKPISQAESEASRARSPQEFVAKVELCAQEADDTQYWLERLKSECGIKPNQTDPISKEADELISIFVTMAKNTKSNRQ
jgi:hypothetical protein